jgi:hypothetical protein
MDKATFIEQAPIYYALAIAARLDKVFINTAVSRNKIESHYYVRDEDEIGDEKTNLLNSEALWQKGIAILRAEGLLEVEHDPFGPEVFRSGADFRSNFREVAQKYPPFSKYVSLDDSEHWLMSALIAVRNTYRNLGIEESDFESLPDIEWQPIQLDPADSLVKEAQEKVEQVIDEVRKDNGYAATHPQERDFNLDGLTNLAARIKSSVISSGYLNAGLDRLRSLASRFANTAKEQLIKDAASALIALAKKAAIKIIVSFWNPF